MNEAGIGWPFQRCARLCHHAENARPCATCHLREGLKTFSPDFLFPNAPGNPFRCLTVRFASSRAETLSQVARDGA